MPGTCRCAREVKHEPPGVPAGRTGFTRAWYVSVRSRCAGACPECLPAGRTGFTCAWYVPVRSPSAGACRNLDAVRFTRRRCVPASRPAIWRESEESDCRDSCWNRNFRDGRIMRVFSHLREFGEKRFPPIPETPLFIG